MVATIGADRISRQEFEACVKHAELAFNSRNNWFSDESRKMLSKKILNKMIDAHLLTRYAIAHGVEELGNKGYTVDLNQLLQSEGPQGDFYRFLRNEGLGYNSIVAHYRRDWIIKRLTERLRERNCPTEQEIEAYYEKHKSDEWMPLEKIRDIIKRKMEKQRVKESLDKITQSLSRKKDVKVYEYKID